jgi:lysophospholipid acyltransferase (LPLAT)-like uncharacterized protein
MIIPLPFSKALFLYGDPIAVPRDADVELSRQALERTMNALADEAEHLVQTT